MTGVGLAPAARERLVEGVRWRLAGLLLERPRPGWREELARLAGESADDGLRRAVARAGDAEEGRYLAVMGPGGALSPREVACHPAGDPGKLLSELTAYYDAFAYHPDGEDPPDHVAVETGFVAYLFMKEAYARSGDAAEDVATTRAARERFVQEHLGPLALRLARHMPREAPEHLRRAADALRDMAGVPADARATTPFPLPGLADEDDGSPCCG